MRRQTHWSGRYRLFRNSMSPNRSSSPPAHRQRVEILLMTMRTRRCISKRRAPASGAMDSVFALAAPVWPQQAPLPWRSRSMARHRMSNRSLDSSANSLVRIYQANTPFPIIDYRTVTNADPTTNALFWDTPLTPAFNVALPLSFETVEFSLTVYADGLLKESFAGLSLNPKHPRYVEIAVNPSGLTANGTRSAGQRSRLIRVKNLLAPDFPPVNLPSIDSPLLNDGLLILSGGRDGIAALRPLDFSGDTGSEQKWGLRTLEDIDEVSILAAPDLLIEPTTPVTYAPIPQVPPDICLPFQPSSQPAAPPPPQPIESVPQFTLDEIFRVQQAIAEHCQSMLFRFAILDPPDFGYPSQRIDLGEVQTWRQRFDTEFAALYYPWVFVNDPLPNPKLSAGSRPAVTSPAFMPTPISLKACSKPRPM